MVTIKIQTDNAAFEECACEEVATILRGLADRIEALPAFVWEVYVLHDSNGNSVGTCEVTR